MASQPQPLRPAVPCASPTGTGGAGLGAGSPEKGPARPKPPVRPKPRVLPKPAVPAKPSLPQPPPGPRHPRPELPSAEKMNRLAGPQPYSGGGSGGPLRRPSFTLKSPETPNGKGLPSPPVAATEDPGPPPAEEVPPTPMTPSRKGPAPFKVTPVPVATKLERFPGTTVEEILAKMDSREGPGSPDRARLSPFCPDPSSRFGSKTFTAFRRRPSGEADGDPPGEARQTPQPTAGELGTGDGEHPIAETRDSGLRRSSEGVLQPPAVGQGMGELGGSLSALPRPGDPPPELSLGSESGWSLSQSFEWTFPSRGARRLASPPQSPIRETADSGLSAEGESDGEDLALGPPCSWGDSGSQGPGSRGAEGAPCPGGPVPQREAEGSAEEEEEEGELERDVTVPCFPLCVTEPSCDPAELETPAQPGPLTEATPPSPGMVDDCPTSPQGPGGPGQAEGPPRDPQPHGDPGWLEELLSSPGAHSSPQDLLGWSRKDLCSEFGIGRPQQARTFNWTPEAVARERDWPGDTEQDREFGTKSSWDSSRSIRDGDRQDSPFGSAGKDWGSDYKGTELMGETRLGCSNWPKSRGAEESCLRDRDFGAGQPQWGTGYGLESAGSREEMGSGKAHWSRSYGVGHGQQQEEELSSRQPSWAGRYSSGDTESRDEGITPAWAGRYGTSEAEVKDRELTPDWTSKYSSRDAESKEEDFTLGWAGRSSTGDTGTPEKEFSPSRPAWDSKYSSRDMESQDREFSPSRPAWTGEYSTRDMESQDREFSPSRPAEADGYTTRDVESQDREFQPRRSAWDDGYSSREMETQDKEFKPSRPTWDDEHNTRDVERQDREFSPSRPAWDSKYSSRDTETQDREFSPSRMAWDSKYHSRDVESQDREFSPSRPATASECSTRDVESQDKEFKPRRSAWDDEHSTRDMETQDEEFQPRRSAWDDEHSTRDTETQNEEFQPRRSTWDDEHSTRDRETQDEEFQPRRSAWDDERSTRDMETQDQQFSPSRAAWDSGYRSGDTESQDREFSPSRQAIASKCSTRDVETQDGEFQPRRSAWDDEHSTRDMETQDEEFSPSRLPWASEYSSREMESQEQEFSPSRAAVASECGSREMESQNSGSKPSRPMWEDRYSTRNMESQDREFSPSRPAWASEFSSTNTEKEDREFSPGRLSWAGECNVGQRELVDEFGVRKGDLPSSGAPDPPAQEPGWGSTSRQEYGATHSRDWAEELGGAERHNQFGIIGTERVPEPCSTGGSLDGSMSWAGGTSSGGLREPRGDWQRDDASCVGTSDASRVGLGQTAWGEGLGHLPAPGSSAQPREAGLEEPGWSRDLEVAGWSVELCNAEATRREWASAFGARCAARSRDFSAEEQSPGDNAGSTDRRVPLSDPSPPMGDTLADPPAAASTWNEPPNPTEEERDLPELAASPPSPRASPPLPEAASRTLPDMESEDAPSDHPDGQRPPSWEEKRLSLAPSQLEGPTDQAGQEFTFLEDTEVLDSSVYRTKANLGRKRRHRAPALRPGATAEGDSWIFRDSTEPRPAPAASSDEETVEEPKSRRVRASLSSKGVKVPLFPGLSTSALKAKLRGRNRSAEEGAAAGDSKVTPPKDPHVQRSKSCKIPGLSGKPLSLPPKPEKSSGSEASPPHWLQALKLKKKKP
ncbi:hypothetical protein llap_11553 [Limosa lapponica baueri]|uniref:Tankyrase 1-binding protein C-terminal domain-containing protein n=1 Tax=Limosa lapponica baueri TaxID=1758121 RepID=A0A2I0TWI6_LIMLA|nr:hypothetical protein llap_11553 [Limosa lapponica baueri]